MKILLLVEGITQEYEIEKFELKQGDEFRIGDEKLFVRRIYWSVQEKKLIPVVMLDKLNKF